MRDRKKTGVIGVEVYVLDIKEETGRTYIKGKATIQAQYRGNVGVTTATTTVLVEYAKMGTVKSLGLKKGDKITVVGEGLLIDGEHLVQELETVTR